MDAATARRPPSGERDAEASVTGGGELARLLPIMPLMAGALPEVFGRPPCGPAGVVTPAAFAPGIAEGVVLPGGPQEVVAKICPEMGGGGEQKRAACGTDDAANRGPCDASKAAVVVLNWGSASSSPAKASMSPFLTGNAETGGGGEQNRAPSGTGDAANKDPWACATVGIACTVLWGMDRLRPFEADAPTT